MMNAITLIWRQVLKELKLFQMKENKEDEYVYPNVITTFIDAATDESGTLQKLITDKGESLQILL